MRKLVTISLLILLNISIYSQQDPVYSQYILNEFLINPSVAGVDGMTTINISGRKQWLGIKYTPETYSASISTRILKSPFQISKQRYHKGSKGRVGIGAAFFNDKNGAINRTNLQFTYAYHIFIQNYQLSFGLKAYTTQMKLDNELIKFRNEDSPEIESLLGKSTFIPDAGAGINFSTPRAHVGFSVTNLFQSFVKIDNINLESNELKHLRQYQFHGFYRKTLANKNWVFEPSTIIRGNEELNFSADLSTRFIYNGEYWAGLSVRTSGELVLLLGLRINRLFVGYSLDYGFNKLSYKSYGSHEVVMALKFGESTRRYRWLERY